MSVASLKRHIYAFSVALRQRIENNINHRVVKNKITENNASIEDAELIMKPLCHEL